MTRRRRSFLSQVTGSLSSAFSAVLWWFRIVVTYPYHLLLSAWYWLIGGGGRRGSGASFTGEFLDSFRSVPALIWYYIRTGALALFEMALAWPRVMRLRDLAAGLPALLALGAVIVTFFFLPDLLHSRQEIINEYNAAAREAYESATAEKDEKKRNSLYEQTLLYYRALSQFEPEDDMYRFNIARVYYELGETNRGAAIIDRLAPRYGPAGFGRAHMWIAENLTRKFPDPQAVEAYIAHMTWCLQDPRANDETRREVHYKLGQLYLDMAEGRFGASTILQKSPVQLLEDSKRHLDQSPPERIDVPLLLANVELRLGHVEVARSTLRGAAARYEEMLKSKPQDRETRMNLVKAYRGLMDLPAAIKALQDGILLKPEPELYSELALTYFQVAKFVEINDPTAISKQFDALQRAFLAGPSNPIVMIRFLQGLTRSPEEAALARQTLLGMMQNTVPNADVVRGSAAFLLGFDAQLRSNFVDAKRYFDQARMLRDDRVPYAVADLVRAVLDDQTKAVTPDTAVSVLAAGLTIWPDDGYLNKIRGMREGRLKNYAGAIPFLLKAHKAFPQDVTINDFLGSAYRGLGQMKNAEPYLKAAAQLRAQQVGARQFEGSESNAAPPPNR